MVRPFGAEVNDGKAVVPGRIKDANPGMTRK